MAELVLQVWTYKGRVAFVLSVLEKNTPIADSTKLQRLSQIMLDIMGGSLGIVSIAQVCPLPWVLAGELCRTATHRLCEHLLSSCSCWPQLGELCQSMEQFTVDLLLLSRQRMSAGAGPGAP